MESRRAKLRDESANKHITRLRRAQLMCTTLRYREGDMRFALITLAGTSREEVPIAKSEYEDIVEAKRCLLESLGIEEKFDFVVENYLELEMTLLESALRFLVANQADSGTAYRERALFNGRLANLLTATRTYVDQGKKHVSSLAPAHLPGVEASLAQEYDRRLGYRVMEALRNYVQHSGFPIQLVTYSSGVVERSSGHAVACSVNPCLRPADLGHDRAFKKQVLHELEAKGESIDLKPLVRDYVEGLWFVHAHVRSLLAPFIERWERVVSGACDRYVASCSEDKPRGLAAVILRDDGKREMAVHLVSDFNEYRRYLESKNKAFHGLTLRYVTSEAADGKP